jgi:2'-5' RNA ligase
VLKANGYRPTAPIIFTKLLNPPFFAFLMKYLIVTLIKGAAGEYQQKLMKDVAEKFGVVSATEKKTPAHITLKYSFETEDIKPVEECLSEFCKNHKKCQYTLKDIDHFGVEVIYIDVIPSKGMEKIHTELIDALRKVPNILIKEYDGKTHFHVSICHADIKHKYKEIGAYLSTESPEFTVKFDNIAILELSDGVWKIHKEYKLK